MGPCACAGWSTTPAWGGRRSSPYAGAMFLGEDLLAYLVLALGAAMAIGSLAALVRPPVVGAGQAGIRSSLSPRDSSVSNGRW
jgi:hypothetical protein